jgi:hypothetical protein
MRLPLLRVSGGFCGSDRYSKQQLQVSSQHKVRTLVYGKVSGNGRSSKWIRKIVGFMPWCAPDEEKEQEYVNQYWVGLKVQCSS